MAGVPEPSEISEPSELPEPPELPELARSSAPWGLSSWQEVSKVSERISFVKLLRALTGKYDFVDSWARWEVVVTESPSQ